MGGTIQVESVRGEGTTFTFRLPFAVNETAASESTTVGEHISDLLRDRRILLVEDNEINMEIAQFYLEEAGAKVEKAWKRTGGSSSLFPRTCRQLRCDPDGCDDARDGRHGSHTAYP